MDKNINPKAVVLARESKGYNQKDLCENLQLNQSLLSKIENGIQEADNVTITKIANFLEYPVEFFYQPDIEIYPPNLFYRKKARIAIQ
jgi:transcriptional regulator with XRE-family HTH domain